MHLEAHIVSPLNRRGRKRKARVKRDSTTGRSRGETTDDAMATVKNYRMRQGVAPEDASNFLAGFTLGRMRLNGLAAERSKTFDPRGITLAQLHAGEAYAALIRSYEAIKGIPSANPRSIDLHTAGGRSLALDPDPEHVRRIKARFVACFDALAETARTTDANGRRPGANLMTLTYDVCVLNRALETLSDEACGDVRLGLNALGRVLT